MLLPVPFYPQTWDYAAWSEMGFDSHQLARHWEDSACGVLCLKMAIDYHRQICQQPSSPPIGQYIAKGLAIGAYHEPIGWNHASLVELAKAFGVPARVFAGESTAALADYINQGRLPIVSIKLGFNQDRSWHERVFFWTRRGGHLALVIGYEGHQQTPSGIYVHHTAVNPALSWQARLIPARLFQSGFTGRGIIVG